MNYFKEGQQVKCVNRSTSSQWEIGDILRLGPYNLDGDFKWEVTHVNGSGLPFKQWIDEHYIEATTNFKEGQRVLCKEPFPTSEYWERDDVLTLGDYQKTHSSFWWVTHVNGERLPRDQWIHNDFIQTRTEEKAMTRFTKGDIVKEKEARIFKEGSELMVLDSNDPAPYVALVSGAINMEMIGERYHGKVIKMGSNLEMVKPIKEEKPFPKLMLSTLTDTLWMMSAHDKGFLVVGDHPHAEIGGTVDFYHHLQDVDVTFPKVEVKDYPKLMVDTGDNCVIMMFDSVRGTVIDVGNSGSMVVGEEIVLGEGVYLAGELRDFVGNIETTDHE